MTSVFLFRRAFYGLLPVYMLLVLFAAIKMPTLRTLDLDMREGMIRNYQYYQTDEHIVEKGRDITQLENEIENTHDSEILVNDNNDSGDDKVLALLSPPGIIGGYRNQFIRFVAFLKYAQINGIRKLLLPSLLWSTTHRAANNEMRFYPVPMELLFDVSHWNSFHNRSLPTLVESVSGESDCWIPLSSDPAAKLEIEKRMAEEKLRPRTKMERKKPPITSPMAEEVLRTTGFLAPVANETFDYLAGKRPNKPRKTNLLPAVENCENPMVIGGGKASGILWNMWDRMQVSRGGPMSEGNEELIALAHQALRPNEKWRRLADQCILKNLNRHINREAHGVPPYLALHARVEVDMMIHRCGKETEKNLTKIFEMVDLFTKDYNFRKSTQDQLCGTFVAVSRNNMRQEWKDPNITAMAEHNWKSLNQRSTQGHRVEGDIGVYNVKPKVFECGEIWMDEWYERQHDTPNDFYGSILPSILNFYIATQSTVFVGVDKSSWSADVWKTRYHLGKGSTNYKYTPDQGIVQLSNGGLPPSHLSCRKMKQPDNDDSTNTG